MDGRSTGQDDQRGVPRDGGPRETTVRDGVSHIFTVDVEEYFQVHAFEDVISPQEWDALPSRVERSTHRLLDLLDERDVSGTFFVLGWVADRHPDLIRRIARRGHEVASHGWWHRRVTDQSPEGFREDVGSAKRLLEDITGQPVFGYRAPRFSIVEGCEWALEVLVEEGYRYDSSISPTRSLGEGGFPGATTTPHLIHTDAGSLLELPLATFEWMGLTLPAGGGAYMRHLSDRWIRRALDQGTREGVPSVFYVHPWELDPDQPRFPVSAVTRLRHYRGLDRVEERIDRLIDEFDFTSAEAWYGLATTRTAADDQARAADNRRRHGS